MLNPLVTPLLCIRYEARFQQPVLAFIDRLGSNPVARKALKHITTHTSGPYRSRYELPSTRPPLYKTWSNAAGLVPRNVPVGPQDYSDEDAQLELFQRVCQASNLESLRTKHTCSGYFSCVSDCAPPIWLSPIVAATQDILAHSNPQDPCIRLHALELNMSGMCGPYLVRLRRLLCLERLHIDTISRDPREYDLGHMGWPKPLPTSKVHTHFQEHGRARRCYRTYD